MNIKPKPSYACNKDKADCEHRYPPKKNKKRDTPTWRETHKSIIHHLLSATQAGHLVAFA